MGREIVGYGPNLYHVREEGLVSNWCKSALDVPMGPVLACNSALISVRSSRPHQPPLLLSNSCAIFGFYSLLVMVGNRCLVQIKSYAWVLHALAIILRTRCDCIAETLRHDQETNLMDIE